MKRVVSALLVCVLLVGVVLSLGSCGKMLSGTYALEVLGKTTDVTLTFKGNKVTSTFKLLGSEVTSEGTYKIEKTDDGMTITFDFGGKDSGDIKSNTPLAFSEGKEDGVKYIKVGVAKYVKQ